MRIRLALLWHMHQPMYVDPASGEAILPWVRLHATHAYYDMARILERHPKVKATVNFVPSLLEQLEGAANGTMPERYLQASRARPEEMNDEERRFVVRQFFMADRDRCVKPLPRYQELLDRRGEDPHRIDLPRFSAQDVRDIQVLFNLTWMGFSARRDEPEVARLLAKGRQFTEEDKASLLAAQQRIVERVVPLWRTLAERRQVELSTTPYFHPILPLVCDSDSAHRAMPEATLPPRFSWPEDAREHVRLALERHERTFGIRPAGMWPAEGSVSPEALAVLAEEGVRWVATDEGVLARSAPAPAHRGELYQPYGYEAAGREVAIAFRDRALSDRIGFTYSRMRASDAVSDFLALVRRVEGDAQRAGVRHPLLPVVLDGENAWEHYEGHGEPFLEELHRTLESNPSLETMTMSEALATPAVKLTRLHSGSWIESNFRIWIGHPEDNLGWDLLGRVRALVADHEKRGDVPAERLAAAKRLLLSAEGSDWFWWYGDDFETENAAEFDQLFRDRLIRAAALVGEPAPARLSEPLSARARRQAPRRMPAEPPTALIRPRMDGNQRSFAEWLGAGWIEPETSHGAMYQGASAVRRLEYGCDLENLYVRVTGTEPLAGTVLATEAVKGAEAPRTVLAAAFADGRVTSASPDVRGRLGDVLEVAIPLAVLGLAPGDHARLQFQLTRDGHELERLPRGGPLPFEVPDRDFERRHWFV